MVLLLLLMIPYFIGVSIKSDDFSRTASILDTSAQSAVVLGTSDYIGNANDIYFEAASITNFLYYFIGFLALISIGSFVKYKIIKK